MENMVDRLRAAFENKRVLVTGHTGFKGSWLVAMLHKLGAKVTGYSLPPSTHPNHFSLLNAPFQHIEGNILDADHLEKVMEDSEAEIVFHLAAQALVRPSYIDPVDTYQSNVIGTLNVLQAARMSTRVKVMVMITTDKVYENLESDYAYKESDRLGGYDLYSSSKACCEILISSYRRSFFPLEKYGLSHDTLIASARAGNVLGGGDWSADRLIPDLMRAASAKQKVEIRNPLSVRPWQHVLDCLTGYLLLAEKLLSQDTAASTAWNFSPYPDDVKTVGEMVEITARHWPALEYVIKKPEQDFHEAGLLKLNHEKAVNELKWKPIFRTEEALEKTIEWYRAYFEKLEVLTTQQIDQYFLQMSKHGI